MILLAVWLYPSDFEVKHSVCLHWFKFKENNAAQSLLPTSC